MKYILMRKNTPITLIDFNNDGTIHKVYNENIDKEIGPLQEQNATNWIEKWWRERSVPISQGRVQSMLKENGLIGTGEYLIRNLGLSLTDYYWIKPLEKSFTWEQVNLFQNNFRNELMLQQDDITDDNEYAQFSPNSSLQGQLEKSWIIIDGKRVLLKGNHDNLSAESINEVIASQVHKMQGYNNYTAYALIKIKDKEYDYGCGSVAFTDQQHEFVSAYGVLSSRKQRNDMSTYEQFINICGMHGMDKEQLRADLEYQILTDFVLSNRDRHLSNIGILRDADTLQFLRMAPIFDTGKSLCVGTVASTNSYDLLSIETNSFAKNELKLLNYVTNKHLVDISKLPDKQFIIDMYMIDSQMDELRIKQIAEVYEKKVDLLERFQQGQNLGDIKRGIAVPRKTGEVFDIVKKVEQVQIAAELRNKSSSREG